MQELTIGKIEKPGVPVLPGSLHGLRVRHVEDPNDLLVLVLVVLVSLVDDLPFDTGMLNLHDLVGYHRYRFSDAWLASPCSKSNRTSWWSLTSPVIKFCVSVCQVPGIRLVF